MPGSRGTRCVWSGKCKGPEGCAFKARVAGIGDPGEGTEAGSCTILQSAVKSLDLSLSAIRLVSSAYLRLLIFLPAILIPACVSSSSVFLMMYSA